MKMTTDVETAGLRRKSSAIAALMSLGSVPNVPNNIPIIKEPSLTTPTSDVAKKKALRFDPQTHTAEFDSEEIQETKRKIKDEIKK